MALPAQAVEKLIQEPAQSQGAYKQFLFLSAALLVLMVVLYAGLAFGYTAYLKSESSKLDRQIQDFAKNTPVDQQLAVANFYSQLVNMRGLLQNHTTASPVLDMLANTATPDVYYTKLNLNASTNEVDLNGVARTLDAAAAAAAILQTTPGVQRINFTNAGQQSQLGGGGGWQFSVSVFLDPAVFKGAGSNIAPAQTVPVIVPGPAATSTATSTATTTRR